jgi:hypothetical protein
MANRQGRQQHQRASLAAILARLPNAPLRRPAPAPAPALATYVHDWKLKICNHTSRRVTKLYASQADRARWSVNILGGGGGINPKACATVDLGPYAGGACRLDLKSVRPDGQFAQHKDLDIRTTATWNLTP